MTSSPSVLNLLLDHTRCVDTFPILDIGSGSGNDAAYLESCGRKVVTLDSCGSIVCTVKGVADALPFRSQSFGLAYCSFLLHLCSSWRLVLGEMTRVVEFGGSVGVITMSHDQLARRFLNRFFPSLYSLDTTRYPSAQDICELYGTLGLTEIIQYEVTEPDANPKADFSDVLRLGQWSSLWQLPETERVNGTERILRAIDEGQLPKWPDLRTVIIGRK